jgi:hypothetical protein
MVMFGGYSERNQAPKVADTIHDSLDQAGYKDVSVKQDRDKGVVTPERARNRNAR